MLYNPKKILISKRNAQNTSKKKEKSLGEILKFKIHISK